MFGKGVLRVLTLRSLERRYYTSLNSSIGTPLSMRASGVSLGSWGVWICVPVFSSSLIKDVHISSLSWSKPRTFTEFWKIYESGGLVQLMEDRIRNKFADIGKLPQVREYLSHPPSDMNLSVWSLKQFLEINDFTESPPVEPVKVDYGFLNCQGLEEICVLAEIYKRLLQVANPLDLHEACIKNRLFELARKYHGMDENYWRLMNNSYSKKVMLES
jgi:hypothetical protein